MGLFALAPFIVLIPFIGVLINAFFGRKLMETPDSKAPGVVATVASALAFVIAVVLFLALLGDHSGADIVLWDWVDITLADRVLEIEWGFRVDTLSSVMMLVVTGVGTLIHIYAIGYMDLDIDVKAHEWGITPAEARELKRRRFSRFFTYLNLFLGSMLILATGNNFLMMFVGWELVGLCSFLLIGFWYDDPTKGLANAAAAQKAFIANRVGDFGMLMAIFLIFWTFGSLQFDEVFGRAECMLENTQQECLALSGEELTPYLEPAEEEDGDEAGALRTVLASTAFSPLIAEDGPTADTEIAFGGRTLALSGVVTWITLFLLLGATGKSAQLPLFVWLPDAMAGPTPVSALIHAATMVTAGIYMITRSNVLYHMAPASSTAVAYVGGATALVAATIAVAQFDIKRVLAYSTISQLGFMIAAVGVGGYIAGVFHLVTHAFFKALLFKGSGSVIQGMERGMLGDELDGMYDAHHHDEDHHDDHHHDDHGHHEHVDPQDMRNMGGLLKQMPVTSWTYIIGSLALAGIFPLAGFWSKDEILLDANNYLFPVYIMLSIAAFFTAFYMGRQVFMVFFGKPRTDAAEHATESPPTMTIPLIVLAVASVLGGLINLPFKGFHQLGHWLEESVLYAHIAEFNVVIAVTSTVFALVAIAIAWVIYGRQPMTDADEIDPLDRAGGPIFTFLENKWYIDELYQTLFIKPYWWLGSYFADTIDWRFWHDYVHNNVIVEFFQGGSKLLSEPVDRGGINGLFDGLAALVGRGSDQGSRLQTGYVRNYALVIGFGVAAVLIYLAIRFVL